MSHLATDDRGIIVRCTRCGQANRLLYTKLADPPLCGRCKARLSPPAEVLEPTSEAQFDALATASALPVLVDFWASWCGPCQAVAPQVARLSRDASGELLVVKVSTEELPQLAARFGVQGIPTFVLLEGGQERGRTSGAMTASQLLAFARGALA